MTIIRGMQIRQLKGIQTVERVLAQLAGPASRRPLITARSAATLKEIAFHRPDLSRQLMKRIVGLDLRARISHLNVPALLAESQNLPVLERLASDNHFLADLLDANRRLDLGRAGLKKGPGYYDLTADFPEKRDYDKMRAVLEPKSLAAIVHDREIGDLALFNSIWLVRAMVYKAQYFLAALRDGLVSGPDDAAMTGHSAASLLGYARRFVTELHGEFPFGTDRERITWQTQVGQVAALLSSRNLGAADAVLVPLTGRLEKACETHAADRLRQERARTQRPAGDLADSIKKLASTKYGIVIGRGGKWSIPQEALVKAGPELRREVIRARVAEGDVVRRIEHELDGIRSEKERNSEVIAAFEFAGNAEPEIALARLDQLFLAKAFDRYRQGRVVQKVEARLLIGLARDLAAVAGFGGVVPDISAAQAKLLKFSCVMLTIAVRQLERRNQTLDRQLSRLEVKKRLLEELVKQRTVRWAALKRAAEALSVKLADDRYMDRPENVELLHGEAVAAYRAFQNDKDLEEGVDAGKKYLADLISMSGQLAKMIRQKRRETGTIALLRRNQPESPLNQEALAVLAGLNLKIMAARDALIRDVFYLQYHLEHRFSAEEPGEPEHRALEETVGQLWERQEVAMRLEKGFVLKSDLDGLSEGLLQ